MHVVEHEPTFGELVHGAVEDLVGLTITRGQPLDHAFAVGVGLEAETGRWRAGSC